MQHLRDYDWPGNVRELRNLAERLVLRATNGRIDVDALPAEILGRPRETSGRSRTDPINTRAEALFHEMLTRRRSFWTEAYGPFMARDLNREEIRTLIRLGLEYTRGSYTMLVSAFNMPPQDYKRFLTFLRKQRCHVPFQQFRVMPGAPADAEGLPLWHPAGTQAGLRSSYVEELQSGLPSDPAEQPSPQPELPWR